MFDNFIREHLIVDIGSLIRNKQFNNLIRYCTISTNIHTIIFSTKTSLAIKDSNTFSVEKWKLLPPVRKGRVGDVACYIISHSWEDSKLGTQVLACSLFGPLPDFLLLLTDGIKTNLIHRYNKADKLMSVYSKLSS